MEVYWQFINGDLFSRKEEQNIVIFRKVNAIGYYHI